MEYIFRSIKLTPTTKSLKPWPFAFSSFSTHISCIFLNSTLDFPGGSAVKNPPANIGEIGSIPGSGRSHGEGNGNSVQDSCLDRRAMDRRAW